MEWTHVFAFNAALLAAMAAPGPALLFELRQSISGGFAKGFSTGMGLALAATFWTTAALLGLEVVFTLFPSTYLVMKFVGAAYLIRLAYVLWRDAKSPISESITSHGRAFRDGLLVNLSNPKSVLFSASVLVVIFPSGLVVIYSGIPSGPHKLADEPISGQRIFYEIRHIFGVDVTCAHKWCTSASDSSTEGKRRVNPSRHPRETAAHSSTG